MPRPRSNSRPHTDYATLNGWISSHGSAGDWRWMFPLPNGWMAGVEDDTQTYDPTRQTEYRIYAISGALIIWGTDHYTTLELAKGLAMALALEQEPRQTPRTRGLL